MGKIWKTGHDDVTRSYSSNDTEQVSLDQILRYFEMNSVEYHSKGELAEELRNEALAAIEKWHKQECLAILRSLRNKNEGYTQWGKYDHAVSVEAVPVEAIDVMEAAIKVKYGGTK